MSAECSECRENVRSPMCKREDCAHTAKQLRLVRSLAQDLRRQFAAGHGTYEALAYLTRAVEAESRLEAMGTRVALAERALRLLRAGKPASREIRDWEKAVKEDAA